MFDDEGCYEGSFGVICDITARRSVEEDLERSEAKLKALFDGIPIPTYTWHKVEDDFVLAHHNRAAESLSKGRIFGLLGQKASETYRDRPDVIEDFNRCFDEQTILRREMFVDLKATGERKYLDVTYAFVPPDTVLVHADDMTSLRWSERALRKMSEEQALLLDNIDIQVWYLTDPETYGAVNSALASFLGVRKSDVAYKKLSDILSREEAEICIAGNREAFESKKQIRAEEWVKNGTGEARLLSICKTPKLNKDGRVEYIVCSAQDITERRIVEKTLKERETALEIRTDELQEVNTALRVLLRQRDRDKTELEEQVFLNVRELVMPHVEKLKNLVSDGKQRAYLNILESNLNEIISPFAHRLSSKYSTLTPTEIQMAFLIRDGKTTKEIADLLNLSVRTVESHRQSIRLKMGIRNKKANLRSHLLSM